MKKRYLPTAALAVATLTARAQAPEPGLLSGAQLHGDFQADVQSYRPDPIIGAPLVPERLGSNTFANLILTAGKFSAGVRYEAYLPPLQGYDPRYRGQGIPYRFATYDTGKLAVTVGNFYEQFGAGLIFRAYEERSLGLDNSIDGLRVRLQPLKGLRVTGLVGRQRLFFDRAPAIVRGLDAEVSLNDVIPGLDSAQTRITVGGSLVSKFQAAEDPTLVLPENVAATAVRANLSNGGFNISAEYAHKYNDPSAANNFIYHDGQALLVQATYAREGLGLVLGVKRVDNMDFRTDRAATGNVALLNFLPALTKQHTYLLTSSIYPYATQPLGEASVQGELTYHVPGGGWAGHYGTDIAVNFSAVNSIRTTALNDLNGARQGYTSDFFSVGNGRYFRDFNVEIHRRFSTRFKGTASYVHFDYNKDVVQGLAGYGIIHADFGILDATYKLNGRHTIRAEAQTLQTKQDEGSWAAGVLEYNYASHFSPPSTTSTTTATPTVRCGCTTSLGR